MAQIVEEPAVLALPNEGVAKLLPETLPIIHYVQPTLHVTSWAITIAQLVQ